MIAKIILNGFLRLILNPDIMLQKNITMDDINYSIKSLYNDDVDCIFSDYIFRKSNI